MSEKTSKAPKPVIEQPADGPVSAGSAFAAAEAEEASQNHATADGESFTAEEKAEDAVHSATSEAGAFQNATWGFIEGVGKRAWSYADAHPHTVLYGAIGLILAILILVLGLWRTIVIAVFVGVGAGIGQMRDGRGGLYRFLTRLFGCR